MVLLVLLVRSVYFWHRLLQISVGYWINIAICKWLDVTSVAIMVSYYYCNMFVAIGCLLLRVILIDQCEESFQKLLSCNFPTPSTRLIIRFGPAVCYHTEGIFTSKRTDQCGMRIETSSWKEETTFCNIILPLKQWCIILFLTYFPCLCLILNRIWKYLQ